MSIKSATRLVVNNNEYTKDYFRVALTIPLLDHVSSDLEYRFPGNKLKQYRGLYIIPSVILNESSDWKKISRFLLIIVMRTFHILVGLLQC